MSTPDTSASGNRPAPQVVTDASDAHHRRSIRLKGYDYSQPGAYFVTINTAQKQAFFDDPSIRQAAEECWREIPRHAPTVHLDQWVVMPDHVHGLLFLHELAMDLIDRTVVDPTQSSDPLSSEISPRSGSLGVIIRTYKAAVTTACRRIGRDDFAWQRNYYEHIVRTERSLNAIRNYIANNPRKLADTL